MTNDQDLAVARPPRRAEPNAPDPSNLPTTVDAAPAGGAPGTPGRADALPASAYETFFGDGAEPAVDPGPDTEVADPGRPLRPDDRTTVSTMANPDAAEPLDPTEVDGPTPAAGGGTVETAVASSAGAAGPAGGGTADTLSFEAPPPGPVLIANIDGRGSGESRGRYTRTQMHAKGGIGQVWLARDVDLGREVALKELRPEQGRNANARARFVEEARITGQLEHPGIVPIYELATRPDDGKPFYTMRFIRGRTLDRAVRDYHEKKAAGTAGPLDLAALLNAFVALCNTAGYAHSRGVVHRDLKGQNVVLGDFGEVVLLDWGIAKLVHAPASGEGQPPGAEPPVTLKDDGHGHEATVDGQAIGTPSYMAPEQAEGRLEAIDARTDVYGLGAILYEILAGRPPYGGTSTQEVLYKVLEGPPSPIRVVAPATPKALEAVCQKAMARRPEDRYPSALALADDVRRWLADEPVSAHREPWPARVARWTRRHRTEAAAAAALLVMAVVGLAASTVLVGRERDEARRQRRQAWKAVDDYYTRGAESWVAERLDPLQREFLEKALAYYRDFAGPDEGDPDLRQDRGRAYLRMGEVLQKLGRHAEAEPAYRRAIEILSRLASDFPAVDEHRDHLAGATFRLGSELAVRHKAAELGEAERLFRQAASIQEALLAGAPSTARRVALGRTLGGLADLLRVTGRPTDSESAFRRAVALLETAAAAEPGDAVPRQELGAALDGLGFLLKERGRIEEAGTIGRRAVEVFEKLVADAPTLAAPRDGLAKARNSLGLVLRDAGRPAESESQTALEVALNRRLAEDYPVRPEYRRTLARGLMNLGIIYRESNRLKEADAAYSEALKINEKLAAESPEVRKFPRDQARCLNNLAELRATRKEESEALYREALKIDRALVAEAPDVPENRIAEAGVLQNLGTWLYNNKRAEEAVETATKAVIIFEELAAADPDDPARRRGLARSLGTLGNAYHGLGQHAEADEAYRRAENAYDLLVSRPGATSTDRLALAACLSNRGNNQTEGQIAGAGDSLRRSLALLDALGKEGPPSPDLRFRRGAAQDNYAEWLASAGRPGDAELAFQAAVDLFDGLAAEFPAVPGYKATLGQARGDFGQFLVAQGRQDDARTLLEAGIRDERATMGPSPESREPLRKHLTTLATLLLDRQAHADAVKASEDLVKVAGTIPATRAEAARLIARCVPLASADATLTPSRRSVIAGAYADRAIALLREAIEGNDPDARRRLRDPAFDPIRDRDGFKALEPEKIGRATGTDRPIL